MERLAAIGVFLLVTATFSEACAGPSANAVDNPVVSAPATSEDGVKTLKERLSDKASDEQRVDNCGVPLDQRGPLPRPDCPGIATTRTGRGGNSSTPSSSPADQGSASR